MNDKKYYNSQRFPKEPVSENIIYGRNSVRELIRTGRAIDKIIAQNNDNDASLKSIILEAREHKINVAYAEKGKLDQLTGNGSHQGIIAYIPEREYSSIDEILNYAKEKGEPPFLVLCDGIEDPHNLGAIIRTCECCGVHGIIIPKNRSVSLTATVSKSSAGALEHIRVCKVTNLTQTIKELKDQGVWFYCADMDGKTFYVESYKGPTCLVLGSEGFGVSRLVKEECDFVVSIPLYGKVNSLNVSNAAAIILSEVAKQRH